jgi:hypothetical protein
LEDYIRVHLQEIYAESNCKTLAFLGWPSSLW